MRPFFWHGVAGVVTAIGLDMTGLELGWKWVGIFTLIILANQFCYTLAEERA